MTTKSLYRFPAGALGHLESYLRALEADVVNYPSMFLADVPEGQDVCVFVASSDTPVVEIRARTDGLAEVEMTRLPNAVPKPRKRSKPSRTPLKRTPVKRTSAARKKREWARAYGSKERVEFVKSLPCCVCGASGFTENAHVGKGGGAGFKGPYTEIAPLCGPHYCPPDFHYNGCHRVLHEIGPQALSLGRLDLDAEAQKCEQAWQSFSADGAA